MKNVYVNILLNSNDIHILHSCITEHWEMPEFQEQLESGSFIILESLRQFILEIKNQNCDHEFNFTEEQLSVLVKAYEIGFKALTDAEDFETIVGSSYKEGVNLFSRLKENLSYENITR